jgi:hypothetical protein
MSCAKRMEAVFSWISVIMKDSAFQDAEKIADYSDYTVYSVASFTTQGHISENFAYGNSAYLRNRLQTNHARTNA